MPGDGTSSYETDRQSNSDQIHPMTEPDLVSDSRPVDDQLDVTQRLTKEQDDQFDTPSASGWKREDEEGMHPDEQEQPAINEVAYQYQPKEFSKEDKGNVEVS